MPVTLKSGVQVLVLHKLLSHIQADPDSFLVRYLPAAAQEYVRYHLKYPVDWFVDTVVAKLLPLFQPQYLSSITVQEFVYGPGNTQVLDVYGSKGVGSKVPVLVFVHGGIWTLGNKSQYRGVGQRLAWEGFVTVVMSYTTWPSGTAAEQAHEVALAVEYVTAHAQEWGGDPASVYLCGHSSGANVSALALLLHDKEAGATGCRVAGFVGIAGTYDLVEHFEFESRRGVQNVSMMAPAADPLADHSPTLLLGKSKGKCLSACDRVLLLHGELDITVPPSQSAHFALALVREQGPPVDFVSLPGMDHASFWLDFCLGRQCIVVSRLKQFCRVPLVQTSRL